MAEVLLFHHALGLTDGFEALAQRLRAAGHAVHTPDLFDGAVFTSIDQGVDHARRTGFDVVIERGVVSWRSSPRLIAVPAGRSRVRRRDPQTRRDRRYGPTGPARRVLRGGDSSERAAEPSICSGRRWGQAYAAS